MNKIVAFATGLVLAVLGCMPAGQEPPGVRSLRQQRHHPTLTLPVWDADTAQEIAANLAQYSGKALIVETACLDPKRPPDIAKDTTTLYLRGGGAVVLPTAAVPGWLKPWTSVPLKFRALCHPQREGDENGPAAELLFRGQIVDAAHPLELTSIDIERSATGTWLTAHVENVRHEAARATFEVRFGAVREKIRLPALSSGDERSVRLQLFGRAEPRWKDFAPSDRVARLVFDDDTKVEVDLGRWLEAPSTAVLVWGYDFRPPGNAVMVLSADRPEAELERFAALELRSYLRLFTDANIEPREPEAKEPFPAQPLLVVGTAQYNTLAATLVREAGIEERLRSVGPDGYILKSLRHNGQPTLLVAANTGRGLINGVYGLVQHYGVRFTFVGTRFPARTAFRVLDLDEARSPVFARRQLVAMGPTPSSTARWSQGDWISMFDLAARNRFNQVVFPLDGLEATFSYEPHKTQRAIFPFEVGPYSCLAEARIGHQHGLAVLADYARRRGLDLSFAQRNPEAKLAVAAPPACLPGATAPADLGKAIDVIEDPGDILGLARTAEAAEKAQKLIRAKSQTLTVPFRRGAGARVNFLAQFAWNPSLTPKEFAQSWAATLCDGKAVERLAEAVMALDRIDSDILAAVPKPLGLGAPLALPVEPGDLACDWARLKARATGEAATAQVKEANVQIQKLRELQQQLEPIQTAYREALGASAPAWEDPLFENVPPATRPERVAQRLYMLRAFLGALATIHEGTVAYYAGLATPEKALPQFRIASSKYRKARRILIWEARGTPDSDMAVLVDAQAEALRTQTDRLAELLGPVIDVEPVAPFQVEGSDAILYLFRTAREDIYAAYKLSGREVVPLRLPTSEARLVRRGQPPKPIHAEAGAFLVALDTVPTYIIARRSAWPGKPPE